MTNRKAYLTKLVRILSFFLTKLSLPVVLGADDYEGVRLLTDIRYDQSSNHDAHSMEGRSLIASYDSSMFTADAINIPAVLIVELPDQSTTTFSKSSFQVIGPTDRISGNAFHVWNGNIKGDHKLYSSGKASIVISPSGNLFCNIKIGGKNFECKRCEQESGSEQNQISCVKVKEAARNENEMPRKLIKKEPNEYRKRENWQIDEDLPVLRKTAPKSVTGMQNLGDVGTLDDSYLPDNLMNITRAKKYIDDGTVVDIAILHTVAAVDYFGSEEELQAGIGILISRQNEIFSNTDIELEVRVVFWGAAEFNEDDNGDSSSYIETDPTVQLIRQKFGADIVIMLTMEDFNRIYAANPPSRKTDVTGYAVLVAKYIFIYDTFLTRAFGELFGCAYDFEYEMQQQVIPYAYGYRSVNCDFHTFMSDGCFGGNTFQVNAYSSPRHFWPTTREAIGNANSADCSRTISETKIFVAQYRDSVDFFTSSPTHSPTSAHTVMPTLIDMPTTTSAPANVHNNCIGDCFSVQFESILVHQELWDEALMGNFFITAVQDVTQVVPDAEKSIVVIENGTPGTFVLSHSKYRENRSPATKITYTVEHINTEAATFDVFLAVFLASESGELLQTLIDSTFYYTAFSIFTKEVGDPEMGTAIFVPNE